MFPPRTMVMHESYFRASPIIVCGYEAVGDTPVGEIIEYLQSSAIRLQVSVYVC